MTSSTYSLYPMNPLAIIRNGITTENPTFVLLLGMCPTLAPTSSAANGMAMGLATMFVLICSNTVISMIKSLVPDAVRIPRFIVVIAGFVTIVRELLGAGTIFGHAVYPKEYGALLFVLAPGAFIVLGYLIALSNKIGKKK